MWKPPPTYDALWVWLPQTWLLQQAHGAISARDASVASTKLYVGEDGPAY